VDEEVVPEGVGDGEGSNRVLADKMEHGRVADAANVLQRALERDRDVVSSLSDLALDGDRNETDKNKVVLIGEINRILALQRREVSQTLEDRGTTNRASKHSHVLVRQVKILLVLSTCWRSLRNQGSPRLRRTRTL
jgi:hypothetical protein